MSLETVSALLKSPGLKRRRRPLPNPGGPGSVKAGPTPVEKQYKLNRGVLERRLANTGAQSVVTNTTNGGPKAGGGLTHTPSTLPGNRSGQKFAPVGPLRQRYLPGTGNGKKAQPQGLMSAMQRRLGQGSKRGIKQKRKFF